MSVFTTDTPLARQARAQKTEFCVYFAIIFLAALPLAAAQWALALVLPGPARNRGMFARAWTHAREITPMIFSA